MTDQHDLITDMNLITWTEGGLTHYEPAFLPNQSFTRSNGTMISRLYERLTKASRRRVEHLDDDHPNVRNEEIYRAGLYDAYRALQEELSE